MHELRQCSNTFICPLQLHLSCNFPAAYNLGCSGRDVGDYSIVLAVGGFGRRLGPLLVWSDQLAVYVQSLPLSYASQFCMRHALLISCYSCHYYTNYVYLPKCFHRITALPLSFL